MLGGINAWRDQCLEGSMLGGINAWRDQCLEGSTLGGINSSAQVPQLKLHLCRSTASTRPIPTAKKTKIMPYPAKSCKARSPVIENERLTRNSPFIPHGPR